jgi:UDP-N-acetylglucosamine:LPS N-acetylglucosamine transferase
VLLPLALVEAIWQIFRFRPHLVVGVGGYVTGPVVVAAKLLGKPTLIHEQNSVPGLANRKLGALASRICLSLPGSERFFPPGKTVLTGNPVRHQILELARQHPARQIGANVTILILGGSLGAHRVNELVVDEDDTDDRDDDPQDNHRHEGSREKENKKCEQCHESACKYEIHLARHGGFLWGVHRPFLFIEAIIH